MRKPVPSTDRPGRGVSVEGTGLGCRGSGLVWEAPTDRGEYRPRLG